MSMTDFSVIIRSAVLLRLAGFYEEDIVENEEMISTGDLMGTIFGDLQQISMQELANISNE